jgi:hypothetical protein
MPTRTDNKTVKTASTTMGKAVDCKRNITSALSALRRDDNVTKHVQVDNPAPVIIAVESRKVKGAKTHNTQLTCCGYISPDAIDKCFADLETVLSRYAVPLDTNGDYVTAKGEDTDKAMFWSLANDSRMWDLTSAK